MIVPIRLSISNAFLIKGARPVLIDTGCPGDHATLVQALAKEGVAIRDLALILHTHGHRDHAGGTHQLKQQTAAPAAIHPADADMLRKGAHRPLIATNLTGRLIRPFVDKPFPAMEPDVLLEDGTDLSPYGIVGRIITTPGHTLGSVSVLFENGEVVAGDVLVGGYLGGLFAAHVPGYPYFAEDMGMLRASIAKLLGYSPAKLYTGHGGPLQAEAIHKRFECGRGCRRTFRG
ncbi:MAG TPA: MBL fold metallo-hydrolase [Gemmataceae bacterium]|nr:MBL fold metallo-hydrolase [Gemmataceae bacterium]